MALHWSKQPIQVWLGTYSAVKSVKAGQEEQVQEFHLSNGNTLKGFSLETKCFCPSCPLICPSFRSLWQTCISKSAIQLTKARLNLLFSVYLFQRNTVLVQRLPWRCKTFKNNTCLKIYVQQLDVEMASVEVTELSETFYFLIFFIYSKGGR